MLQIHSTDNLCSSPLLFAVTLLNKRSFFIFFFPYCSKIIPVKRNHPACKRFSWVSVTSLKKAKKPIPCNNFVVCCKGSVIWRFLRGWDAPVWRADDPVLCWGTTFALRTAAESERTLQEHQVATMSNLIQSLLYVEMSPINRVNAHNR